MQLKNNQNQIFKELSLKLVKSCPNCKASFVLENIEVVDESGGEIVSYFSCGNCQSSLVAKINQLPFGVVGHAMMTDLEREEVMMLGGVEGVTEDGVLEIYQKLVKS